MPTFDFRSELNKWRMAFDSDNKNCILRQVQQSLFETLIYRCILKARSMAPKDTKQRIKLSGVVHYLIDKCFFNDQLMTIRRLTDRSGDAISLARLLNQMKGNRKHLTRRNYFEVLKDRGYEYDYSETKRKEDAYIAQHLKVGEVIAIPEELDWQKSAQFHSDFDKLSKTSSLDRKPQDIIDGWVFDKLLHEIDCCGDLRDYIDAFLAHSLKPDKIGKLDDNALRVTFESLWKAQQSICKVTKFIGLYLLGRIDYGLLPLMHGSFLRYIEEPLVSMENKSILRGEEDEFRKEVWSWAIKIDDLERGT